MPRIPITDPSDVRLADYRDLTDVALRSRHEPSAGMYIAESEKVLRRALHAGHAPRSVLVLDRFAEAVNDLAETVPVFVGSPDVLEAITGFNVHRGMLAAMHRPALPSVAEVLLPARRVAVLDGIVDHTNVGAIFRSAAAMNVDAVLITPTCADPLYRRSVRVSMGTVFQVPWTRIDPWPDTALLTSLGFTTAAFALTHDSVALDDLADDPPDRLALVFGTEGVGLADATMRACDLAVRIPMAGGVDSLNVAAASAVAFWALRLPS